MLRSELHPTMISLIRRLGFGVSSLLCVLLFTGAQAFASNAATTITRLYVTSGEDNAPVTTIAAGKTVTLTAKVTSSRGPVKSGFVNFCNAAALHCSDVNIIATVQLKDNGSADDYTATLKMIPAVGIHGYRANFVETSYNQSSSSIVSTLTVTGNYPTTTLIAPTGSQDAPTLRAIVSSAGESAPTGTVSFLDKSQGSSVLGTATLGVGIQEPIFAGVSSNLSPFFPTTTACVGPIHAADVNGDHKLDLVVLIQGFCNPYYNPSNNQLVVLLGNGDGTFGAPRLLATPFPPSDFVVADFLGKGNQDIAISSAIDDTFAVLLGQGDGTFQPIAPVNAGLQNSQLESIRAGDFNGDGILDLALVGQPESGVPSYLKLALGVGDGTFTISDLPSYKADGLYPSTFVVGDINNDGRADLLSTSFEGLGTAVGGLQWGNAPFSGVFDYCCAGFNKAVTPTVALADLNGDGNLDALILDPGGLDGSRNVNSEIDIYFGHGDGTFTRSENNNPLYFPSGFDSMAVGDFNNDGIPDLVVTSNQDNKMTVLLGKGDGIIFRPLPSYSFISYYLLPPTVGDFNGDGLSDLVTAGGEGVAVSLKQMSESIATLATPVVPVAAGSQFGASYAGDDNNDPSVSSTITLYPPFPDKP